MRVIGVSPDITMLNDTRIRRAKACDRAFKLYDERGLFLLITPTGGRLWRLKFQLHGREKLISLGTYPDVTLTRARERREALARKESEETWLAAAQLALTTNRTTFALLPINDLVRPDGYVAKLRALGYSVDEP